MPDSVQFEVDSKVAGQFCVPMLWPDLTIIEESAATAALIGTSLDDLVDPMQVIFDEANSGLAKRFDVLNDQLMDERAEMDALKVDLTAELATLSLTYEANFLAAQQNHIDEDQSAFRVLAAARKLVSLRQDYVHLEARKRFEHRRELARQLAELASEDSTANESRNERLKAELERKVQEVNATLDEVRAENNSIQLRGLTRQVAGFLHWAAYFSFAGVGVLLGHVFVLTSTPAASGPTLLGELKLLLGVGRPGRGIILILAQFFGVVLLMLVFLAVSVVLTNAVISRIDSRTKRDSKKRQKGSLARVVEFASLLQLAAPTVGTGFAQIHKSTLVQLIAAIPLVVAVAIVAFVWIVAAPVPVGPTPASWQTIYVGTLFAVLQASNGLLLWTMVLRPIMVRDHVRKITSAFYTMLFFLPPLALIGYAVAIKYGFSGLAPSILGIAVLVALVGLGHGTYLRGIFRREDYLIKKRESAIAALEKVLRMPTTLSFLDQNPNVVWPDRSPKKRAPFWSRIKSRVQRDQPSWTFWLKKKREETPTTSRVERADTALRYLLENVRVPIEDLNALNSVESDHVRHRAERLVNEQSATQALEQMRDCKRLLAECHERRSEINEALSECMQQYQNAKLALRENFNRVRGGIVEAYGVTLTRGAGSSSAAEGAP